MVDIEAKTRRWGSSIGLVLPKKIVEEEGIKPNEKIVITIKKKPLAKEFFGKFPHWGKSAQELKDEMRSGWESASDSLADRKPKK